MSDALTPEQLAELAKYDSPTICNAIELFKVRPQTEGYLNHTVRALYPDLPPMVGYAYTFELKSRAVATDAPQLGFPAAVAQTHQNVQTPRIAVLAVTDPPEQEMAAAYGDVMVSCVKAFGAIGLVTNGYARDLEPVGKMEFPCFATGVCVSHGYPRVVSAGKPAQVGGLSIRCGDLLHADANGVTTIPHQIAPRLAKAARHVVDSEAVVLDYLKAAGPTAEGLSEKFEQFKAKLNMSGTY